MKKVLINSVKYLLILALASAAVSCKKNKDAKLPSISFKSGGNYTSGDATVTTSDLINAGITADKNAADLKTFKIYSAVGNNTLSLSKTYSLTPDEKDHYEKDYQFHPENKNNFETWKFEITDADGNSNSVTFKLTVH